MAGEEIDGTPVGELPIDEVVWSEERARHIRTRAERKGPAEIDIEPLWAGEAALEAERLADRIAVIAAGRIVAEGTAATIGGRDTEASIVSFTLPSGVAAANLPPAVAGAVTSSSEAKVEARVTSPLPLLGALAAWAEARNVDLPDLQVFQPTLEDVYLQLTRESQ